MSTQQDDLARRVIRDLLDGKPPDGTDPQACGGWADTVDQLYQAHAKGGTADVKKVYVALAAQNPDLTRLVASNTQPRKTRWTFAELYSTDFPDPIWAVPDILPEGLVFLAGRPKVGKSWLALQIAHAVATGGMVLDRRATKGRVLYLALEDNERRLKGRGKKHNIPAIKDDLTLVIEWKYLGTGGLTDLQAEIEAGGYRLVVIDTLTRALGSADQMDLAEMSMAIGNLQTLAGRLQITILVIDHLRKQSGNLPDPIEDVMGSTGKTQPLDGVIGLYKEQGQHRAKLIVKGRDLDELELALQFDGLTCAWQSLGSADQVRKDTLEMEVVTAIQDLIDLGELPTNARIASYLSKNPSNVSRALADLVKAGHVIRGKKQGREVPYELP